MMQISSRFTIAIHILVSIEVFEEKPTSELLAGSIGTHPVIVRMIIKDLREAGLLHTQRGSGGAKLTRTPAEITFYDIYRAVHSIKKDELFKFHEEANPNCEVGRNLQAAIEADLLEAQKAMEDKLKSKTLEEAILKTRQLIEQENSKN